jgi:hypothetical protein
LVNVSILYGLGFYLDTAKECVKACSAIYSLSSKKTRHIGVCVTHLFCCVSASSFPCSSNKQLERKKTFVHPCVLAAGCSSHLPACLKVFALYNWPDRALVGSYVDSSLLCPEQSRVSENEASGSARERRVVRRALRVLPQARTGASTGCSRGSAAPTGPAGVRRRFRSSSTTGEELRKARETRDRREEGGVRGSAALSCCYSLSWL